MHGGVCEITRKKNNSVPTLWECQVQTSSVQSKIYRPKKDSVHYKEKLSKQVFKAMVTLLTCINL